MVETVAIFIEFVQGGYYSFKLENGDVILFEQINKNILTKYDLKSLDFKQKKFKISYIEIFDDEDDEDFLVFKLEKAILL